MALQGNVNEVQAISGTVAAVPSGSSSGGTTDHSKLSNRDAADQHPIEAITGLKEKLQELDEKIEYFDSSQNALLTIETISIGSESATVAVTGVTLDYSSLSLNEGETTQLAAAVTPSNATNTAIIWETSASGVATVKNGLVTAIGAGSCTITARSAENSEIYASCAVEVAAESGGDSGTTDGKTMFSSLTPAKSGAALNKNGTTELENTSAWGYFILPYSEGMQISTIHNSAWAANYPAIFVNHKGVVTIPDSTATEYSGTIKNYAVTLTGFDESAVIYVNATAGDANGINDDMKSYCYYIPGGAA